ncbi:MAG: hypothetical protein GVY04_15390 [Cyanobacteria bacterium]|jgi:hypothetical protein|nr:hypothetical protein [Cyanobacteria bacterium GSL.Bin1]
MIHRDKTQGSTRFSLILPKIAAIAEAKLQSNPFLENPVFVLPVSRRDRLFFSFSYLFRQQPKRDQMLDNLKSAMIALAKHLIVATSVPNQQL